MTRRDRAAAAAARTRAALQAQRLARYRMARAPAPSKRVSEFHAVMARLERVATEAELVDAAAALAQPPGARQGRLL